MRGGQAGAGCFCLSSLASSSTLEAFPGCSVESREPRARAGGQGEEAVPAEAGGGTPLVPVGRRVGQRPSARARTCPTLWALTEHPAHGAACCGLRTPVRLQSVPKHRCQEAACWGLILPGQKGSHSPLGSPGSPDCLRATCVQPPGIWRRVGDPFVMSAAGVEGDVVAWTEASKSRARLGAAAHMVTPDRDAGSTEPLPSCRRPG